MPAEEVRLSPARKKAGYSAAAWLIGWVVFLGSGYLTSLLLFGTWANCDIGANGVGQLFSLVVTATGMAAVSTVLWAGMRKATGHRRLLLPLALTALATAVLLWPMLAVWYVSPGHPESMCEPGGRPVWWPSWLPL
ncbi:hypothetical protein Shyhy01_19990 [Streptomyces hygroscopicus subsp. hygroscopicus]|uniref:hypothetical protein n=1 Tax=Streptomyces sp. KHY 26 TaxID=3097359 RepID=UPI0024A4EE77|nr:hypothetical protein [Streptomyces hygroscopicus]GLX49049.1 hypothetical protein Shyhy01_19990 [Streptomyces hygroscopicus subsp. hygroscopicus]